MILPSMLHDIRAHSVVAAKLRRAMGRSADLRTAIRSRKRSDTLFILGSGPSIADLHEADWDHIRQHNSLALNKWYMHPFVPDYYLFELKQAIAPPFVANVSRLKAGYRDTVFVWSNPALLWKASEGIANDADIMQLKAVLQDLTLCIPAIVSVRGESPSVFIRNYTAAESVQSALSRLGYEILLQKRGSLSGAINLGVATGFARIVLCGVDLNTPRYFWDLDTYSNELSLLPPRNIQRGFLHKTNDPAKGAITMDQIIYFLDELLRGSGRGHLFVASPASALYPRLPQYVFPENGRPGRR